MRVLGLMLFGLAGFVLTPPAVVAQEVPKRESKVRITLRPGSEVVTGRFVRSDADSIVIRARDGPRFLPRQIPRPSVERIELSRGGVGRAARIGVYVGGAAGLLYGLLVPVKPDSVLLGGRAFAVTVLSGMGVTAGALVGALVGLASRERWVPAVLPEPVGRAGTVLRVAWRLSIRF